MFTKKTIISAAATAMVMVSSTAPAKAGTDMFLGEIIMVGQNFCPRNFADTNGQLLAIHEYQALYSLLGTMYGGDGLTTFALPDLRGRAPIHAGKGAGMDAVKEGDQSSYFAPKGTRGKGAQLHFLGMRYCISLTGTYPSRN